MVLLTMVEIDLRRWMVSWVIVGPCLVSVILIREVRGVAIVR